MLNLAILIGIGALVSAVVIHAITIYHTSTGTVSQRLLATSRDSATWGWSKIVALSGLLLVWLDKIADFLNLPEMTAFINAHLTPTNVGIAVTAIAVVTLAARARSLFAS